MPLTKSGRRRGQEEAVTIDDPWIGALLFTWCHSLSPGDFLSSQPQHVHRARLHTACRALSIDWGFRWYSLRRGAATEMLRRTGDIQRVLLRGRWGHLRTARIYLTDGLARAAELQVAGPLRTRLLRRARRLRTDYLA